MNDNHMLDSKRLDFYESIIQKALGSEIEMGISCDVYRGMPLREAIDRHMLGRPAPELLDQISPSQVVQLVEGVRIKPRKGL